MRRDFMMALCRNNTNLSFLKTVTLTSLENTNRCWPQGGSVYQLTATYYFGGTEFIKAFPFFLFLRGEQDQNKQGSPLPPPWKMNLDFKDSFLCTCLLCLCQQHLKWHQITTWNVFHVSKRTRQRQCVLFSGRLVTHPVTHRLKVTLLWRRLNNFTLIPSRVCIMWECVTGKKKSGCSRESGTRWYKSVIWTPRQSGTLRISWLKITHESRAHPAGCSSLSIVVKVDAHWGTQTWTRVLHTSYLQNEQIQQHACF